MRGLILAVLLAGCGGVEQSYVQADRDTYDVIAPAYVAYVSSDQTLTEEQRERRLRTVQTWELRVQTAEEVQGE